MKKIKFSKQSKSFDEIIANNYHITSIDFVNEEMILENGKDARVKELISIFGLINEYPENSPEKKMLSGLLLKNQEQALFTMMKLENRIKELEEENKEILVQSERNHRLFLLERQRRSKNLEQIKIYQNRKVLRLANKFSFLNFSSKK